jgi:hypothetical protein
MAQQKAPFEVGMGLLVTLAGEAQLSTSGCELTRHQYGSHGAAGHRPDRGPGQQAYAFVCIVLQHHGLGTVATEPVVLSAAAPYAVDSRGRWRIRHIKYKNPTLSQVVQRLRACWVGTIVQHRIYFPGSIKGSVKNRTPRAGSLRSLHRLESNSGHTSASYSDAREAIMSPRMQQYPTIFTVFSSIGSALFGETHRIGHSCAKIALPN